MESQKQMCGIGDGVNKMKIKDEMKLDLHLSSSHSSSNRPRFKLYPIEEVTEQSSNSSSRRLRTERDTEIQRILEEYKRLGMNRPKSSHRQNMAVDKVNVWKPVALKSSEESVMASVFVDNRNDATNNEKKPAELGADKKIAEFDAAVDEILTYKHSQICRLSVASSYEYQKRMLLQNKSSSLEQLSMSKSLSITSTLRSYKTTSCFAKLFCPFGKSRR